MKLIEQITAAWQSGTAERLAALEENFSNQDGLDRKRWTG